MNKSILWVDNITLPSLLKIFFLILRNDIKEVYYLSGSQRLLNLLIRLPKDFIEFHRIIGRYLQIDERIKDLQAVPLNSRINQPKIRNFHNIMEAFIYDLDLGKNFDEKIELFFTQSLASDLRKPLELIYHLQIHNKLKKDILTEKIIVLMKRNYWLNSLREYYGGEFERLETYPNGKGFVTLCYHLIKVVVEILYNTILIVAGKTVVNQKNDKKPKIAVLHTQGADINKRSDYFWFPESRLAPEDIILYFKHHNRPPSEEVLKHVRELGIPWFDLLPVRLGFQKKCSWIFELNRFPSWFYIQSLLKVLLMNFRVLRKAVYRKEIHYLWFWKKFIHLLDDTYLFQAFFRLYNVKMHFGAYEMGRHMTAANLAIHWEGGSDLCHHWSTIDFVDVEMGKPHDVCFTWGPYYRQHFFNRSYYHVAHYVFTGYSYDFSFKNNKIEASKHRKQLMDRGAEFIISYFDQSLTEEGSAWNLKQEKIFEFLLKELLRDEKLGLILKPKKANGVEALINSCPDSVDLLQAALLTGRCLVLGKRIFPNEASQASDLSIGMGASSTPALESVLAGIPAITYDADNYQEHPMYTKGGYNRIIFRDMNVMFESIRRFKENRTPGDFGDYSSILFDIDPFQDGHASRRVGFYMKELLDGFHRGADKTTAIGHVNQMYRSRFGLDKVESVCDSRETVKI